MGFSRQEYGVGCHAFFQRIFPTQGSNPSPLYLLHWQVDFFFTTCATWEALCYLPAAAAAKSLQSCLTLCNPIDSSPPGSPIPGILQARTLELGCHFLLQCMKVKSESEVAQSHLTLSDSMDCSLPGSPIPGILQARTLEWGAISFSSATYLPSPKLSGESTEQLKRILHTPCSGLVM